MLSDKDAALIGKNIITLFTKHGGGTLLFSQHSEPDEFSNEPMTLFTVSFVGRDGQRADLSRENPALALAAAAGSEPTKRCRDCKLSKSIECFQKKRGRCRMCENEVTYQRRGRKSKK